MCAVDVEKPAAPTAGLAAGPRGIAARLAVLRVAEDGLAGGADAIVRGVLAQLGQHDQLPHRAALFVVVEAARSAPVVVAALRRLAEQLGHGEEADRRVGGGEDSVEVVAGRQRGFVLPMSGQFRVEIPQAVCACLGATRLDGQPVGSARLW